MPAAAVPLPPPPPLMASARSADLEKQLQARRNIQQQQKQQQQLVTCHTEVRQRKRKGRPRPTRRMSGVAAGSPAGLPPKDTSCPRCVWVAGARVAPEGARGALGWLAPRQGGARRPHTPAAASAPGLAAAAAAVAAGSHRGCTPARMQECWKHEALYPTIFDSLRPWLARGITRTDLDACQPAATPETNTSLGCARRGCRFRVACSGRLFCASGPLLLLRLPAASTPGPHSCV